MSGLADIMGHGLLGENDPAPVEMLNEQSDHPLLLVCEHAGQAIPTKLNGLGISRAALDSHIGWDIGAGAVTQVLAQTLGAPAVFQRYSRLVIDCNRPPHALDSIPEVSDRVDIPENQGLDQNARAARRVEIFEPFHKAVANCYARNPRQIVLSIHSFTPALNGVYRPWDIGLLFRKDTRTSGLLGGFIHQAQPQLTIGMNQPYQIDDSSDWFVPRHGEARGVPHSLIEIRNEHIHSAEGQVEWVEILGAAVARFLKDV
jgi:predicted N-formylglutamate amidohydrolase